jgi:glycosyltransferase involved in cell wall biosynthesis
MRVLMVGNRYPADGGGGYEAVWRALVAGLRARGDEIRVLTTDEPAPALDGVDRALRWLWQDGRWRRPSRLEASRLARHDLRVLGDTLQAFKADVVVWVSMGGLPLTLVGASGLPELALVHDGWPIYGAQVDPHARREGWDPGAVDRWTCNSAFARARVLQELGERVDAARFLVDHPGVAPAHVASVAPAGAWGGRLTLIGRVQEHKGGVTAVQAMAHLPDATLRVVGPPEADHDAQLRTLAASSGVADRVRVEGATSDIAGVYAASDAVLFPVTWPEPFGLVPLEAMAVGRPVVATATGGAAEYLQDGVNALLVPVGDPVALAAAVRRLAGDPALRAALADGGRATAARFTQDAWVRAVLAHIDALAPAAT